jgi:hypothetical protein
MEEQDPDQAVAKHDLEVAIGRAGKAVAHAEKVAPDEVAVKRARVDLLRLEGDIGKAREVVGGIAASGAQPETALTLAALDVAEAEPSWTVAIERLRTAVSGEQSLGRARGLLIYALARSGDLAGARTEHERLAGMSRPHPLAPALGAFIDRIEKAQPAGRKPNERAAASAEASAARPAPTKATKSSSPSKDPEDDGRVPDDYVAPNQGVPVDTSDLPGAHPPPSPSPPSPSAPATTTPKPEIDTSDLPGFKHE